MSRTLLDDPLTHELLPIEARYFYWKSLDGRAKTLFGMKVQVDRELIPLLIVAMNKGETGEEILAWAIEERYRRREQDRATRAVLELANGLKTAVYTLKHSKTVKELGEQIAAHVSTLLEKIEEKEEVNRPGSAGDLVG